jgi:hypothetical protein
MVNNNTTKELLEEELELLQRTKIAILKSRLNAGLLLIPDGLQVWNSENEPEPPLDDLFEEEFVGAMVDSVQDIDTLTTFIPIIVRGPKDQLDGIRHLKFGRDESLDVIQDRIEVIEDRLALMAGSVVE